MVERFNAPFRFSGEITQDTEIVQLASQFAECLIEEITARDGSQRRETGAEKRLAREGAAGAAGNRNAIEGGPINSTAFQAVANRPPGNTFERPRTFEFSLLNGGEDTAVSEERRRGVVAHRREAQDVHAASFLSLPRAEARDFVCSARILVKKSRESIVVRLLGSMANETHFHWISRERFFRIAARPDLEAPTAGGLVLFRILHHHGDRFTAALAVDAIRY